MTQNKYDKNKKGLTCRKWITWTAIIHMLGAILFYLILTVPFMDELSKKVIERNGGVTIGVFMCILPSTAIMLLWGGETVFKKGSMNQKIIMSVCLFWLYTQQQWV